MTVVGGRTHRLFVAVPLPKDLFRFVAYSQTLLPKGHGIRLLEPEQLHVTLAFIGRVDGKKCAAAQAVVRSLPGEVGGEASIGGFLLLPSRDRARVVALQLADQGGVFGWLFELVMGGLEKSGVMEREKRPFRAHLTIARLRQPLPVQPLSESGQAQFKVESVCLYESELRREGARYTIIERTGLRVASER